MSKFEKNLQQESAEFSQLITSLENVVKELPLAYKRIALYPDWLLVMGGGKAGTDVSFWGDTYDDDEWLKFKSIFESEGLRFTELTATQEAGEPIARRGYVYNPTILEQETSNSELVLAFSNEETLQEWMDRCLDAGIEPDAIYGKLYSFPESAIRDFIKFQDSDQELRSHPMEENLGDETYLFTGEQKADVLERERKKRLFFDKLQNNDRFLSLKKSEELEESEKEWDRRLPSIE